jgi:hypothetical protein
MCCLCVHSESEYRERVIRTNRVPSAHRWGKESIGLLCDRVNNVVCEKSVTLRLRPTVNMILGQLNIRTKLCNKEVASLMEQQTKNYVVVIKIYIYIYLGINPSVHLWRYSPFRALASLTRHLHLYS